MTHHDKAEVVRICIKRLFGGAIGVISVMKITQHGDYLLTLRNAGLYVRVTVAVTRTA